MLVEDVQVDVMLDKLTLARSGGEWQTTSEFDFSGQGESHHHVQRAQ